MPFLLRIYLYHITSLHNTRYNLLYNNFDTIWQDPNWSAQFSPNYLRAFPIYNTNTKVNTILLYIPTASYNLSLLFSYPHTIERCDVKLSYMIILSTI